MKYYIYYQSATGNTKLLAETVEAYLNEVGAVKVASADEADLVCIGFWTQQGDANDDVRKYMKSLHDSKVFLFGTAGFGDSQTYFDGILEKADDSLVSSCEIIGSFMCQGKMPAAFREQYENNKSKVPNQGAHYDLMITNFDKALSHPDQSDLNALKRTLAETVAKMV